MTIVNADWLIDESSLLIRVQYGQENVVEESLFYVFVVNAHEYATIV